MTRWTRVSRVAALPAVALAVTIGASAPAQAATSHGCPGGWVCIYPQNKGWNGDKPAQKYYAYGWYNLSGQYGTHRVFNNQTQGAAVFLCKGYKGTGGYLTEIGSPGWGDENLTPVNSIVLTPTTSNTPDPC